MATIAFDNKENFKSQNVVNIQQVHHQQIIIENAREMELSYCETYQKNKPQSNSVAGGKNKTRLIVLCKTDQLCSIIVQLIPLIITELQELNKNRVEFKVAADKVNFH